MYASAPDSDFVLLVAGVLRARDHATATAGPTEIALECDLSSIAVHACDVPLIRVLKIWRESQATCKVTFSPFKEKARGFLALLSTTDSPVRQKYIDGSRCLGINFSNVYLLCLIIVTWPVGFLRKW